MYNNYYPYGYPRSHNFLSGFKKMNWSNLLDGTQKTLSIINQAIPVIYQIKPIIQNAKTAIKVVNEIKKEDTKKENIRINTHNSSNNPTYFL